MAMFAKPIIIATAVLASLLSNSSLAEELEVYVGTSPSDADAAAYVCSFNSETGKLGTAKRVKGGALARIVLFHEQFLITAGHRIADSKKDSRQGLIKNISLSNGESNEISGDRIPKGICALDVYARSERVFVAAADFPNGCIAILPLGPDGSLEPPSCIVQHESLPPIKPDTKKRVPRAHDIKFTPDGKAALVADLGLRVVRMYAFDDENGTLKRIGELTIEDRGPRHLAFHPHLPIAYVVNQLGGSVAAFTYDTTSGKMEFRKRVSTLPANFDGGNHCADIHVHPSGKYLYASNRGHDSIAVFRLGTDGLPTENGHVATGGQSPWSFLITPDGNWLIASHRKSNDLRVFRIQDESGMLTATDQIAEVPEPISIVLRTRNG